MAAGPQNHTRNGLSALITLKHLFGRPAMAVGKDIQMHIRMKRSSLFQRLSKGSTACWQAYCSQAWGAWPSW
jgi:hypothetical protein